MYDYMKALQRQFETIPQSIRDLNDEVNRTHKGPSSRLAKEDRKLLLRLVDLEDNLQSVATLHSFTCGYRLACSIHRELAAESMYSFANREESSLWVRSTSSESSCIDRGLVSNCLCSAFM